MNERTKTARKKRVLAMIHILANMFPDASTSLLWQTPWQLLSAVLLSAQQTDKKVNEVAVKFFRSYPDARAVSSASIRDLERMLSSINYYKTKVRHLKKSAKMIAGKFRGEVPLDIADLMLLPGVGRKTALVVQGELTGSTEGIAVDTHVVRLARKMNLTDYADPIRIEHDLMEIVPRHFWKDITGWLIAYGRNICPARKHDCTKHPLSLLFPNAARRWPRPGKPGSEDSKL